MNVIKNILLIFLYTAPLFSSCSNPSAQSSANKIITDSSSTIAQESASVTDSSAIQKDELTKIYSETIGEYIRAVFKKDKTRFDTLFFGKHVYGQPDDFPDITLPETIEGTQIRLVTPEAGQKLQSERKSLVYINMMGWVNKVKAEFILVTFSNGGEHLYDYYIDYKFNSGNNKYELDKIRFENFLNRK